jgi:large subunit ribosomal protein L13
MIINADNKIVGRVASMVAKAALLGNEVIVVNCDTAIISGKKVKTISEFQRKRAMGIPSKGPFIIRKSNMIMKRTIRGMLPYKQPKGREAFKKIKCYRKIPESLSKSNLIENDKFDVKKLPNTKYVTLLEVCKIMGARE